MRVVTTILLALILLLSLALDKTYRALPIKELKRRARGSHDKQASAIFRMAAYGTSLEVFLWLVTSLSAAALIIMSADYRWWLALIFILLVSWLAFGRFRQSRPGGLIWRAMAFVAPLVSWLLSFLHPLLDLIGGRPKQKHSASHTKAYEKEDLLEFINRQNQQADNRIPEADLHLAFSAITFNDKTVGGVMTPRKLVKMVTAGDPIGPHLMDELHASGFVRFPVVKNNLKISEREIVGVLELKDLIGFEGSGRVRDLMHRGVYFINEAQSLLDSLSAFLKTGSQLLVVINNFEEIVGVLNIEDVLAQLLGQKPTGEFERYDNIQAVASLDKTQKHPTQNESKLTKKP
jgi:CBS domain containing-hemolysin-like protein